MPGCSAGLTVRAYRASGCATRGYIGVSAVPTIVTRIAVTNIAARMVRRLGSMSARFRWASLSGNYRQMVNSVCTTSFRPPTGRLLASCCNPHRPSQVAAKRFNKARTPFPRGDLRWRSALSFPPHSSVLFVYLLQVAIACAPLIRVRKRLMRHFSFLTARLRFIDRPVLARALLTKRQRMVRCAIAPRSAVA
jgi:hypothetical protein